MEYITDSTFLLEEWAVINEWARPCHEGSAPPPGFWDMHESYRALWTDIERSIMEGRRAKLREGGREEYQEFYQTS
jgi:hypothetical protein